MAKLFFDLDGTVWDSRERVYRLFCDLAGPVMDRDEYWTEKRNKITNGQLLERYCGYDDSGIKDFESAWLSMIEKPEYLSLDRTFDFTIPTLEYCTAKKHEIYFVTLRQSADAVKRELRDKGLLRFCKECLVSEGRATKAELVRSHRINAGVNDFFIGDTGVDILAGKELGVSTVAVLSGFRNEQVLRSYGPDHIINDISNINEII